jgi:hypothetical protein
MGPSRLVFLKPLCATARDNGKEMTERVDKIAWSGTLVAIQPRIRLLRSFDQRDHAYLGYSLRVDGIIGEDRCKFTGLNRDRHLFFDLVSDQVSLSVP